MSRDEVSEQEIYRFILNLIDSVPNLEALLLLRNSRGYGRRELVRISNSDTLQSRHAG